jgi:REP element-mobilizing transposase RayT
MTKQMSLNLNRGTWGGRRTKCGRKRIHSRGVSHRTRESVNPKRPLHVNFKYRVSIRNKEVLKILKRALINSGAKGLRILHYSVQSNHMHFILEADNNKILETGMRSLTVTIAKGINKGKVQLERYHLHVLKTIRETKNAISYVLFNEQKHSGKKCIELDGYSSLHSLDARALARKAKLTLVISKTKADIINITEGRSFLANTALDQLIC